MAKKQKPAADAAKTEPAAGVAGAAATTAGTAAQTETKAPVAPVVKDIQNGITRPKAGTTCGRVWAICEALSTENNAPAERGDVIKLAEAEGINSATTATQHGKWRKYYGLTNSKTPEEIAAKKQEREAAKAKAAEERKAKADAKAAEKAAKEQAKKDNAAAAATTAAASANAVNAAGSDVSIEADKVD